MKTERVIPWFAIAASAVAIGVSVTGSGGDADKDDGVELARMAARLERLESKIDRLGRIRTVPSMLQSAPNATLPDGGEVSVEGIQRNQQQLESRLKELGVIEHFAALQEHVEESYQVALNGEAPTKSRLEALETLRDAGRIDGAVVGSMMEVWNQSLEAEKWEGHMTRWSLMESLDDSGDPRFRDSLISWIAEEESPKMRGRGVQSLGAMLPDPAAEEWLTHFSESDPEESVRNSASRLLGNGDDK